jgi:hypothetical protein
VRLTKQQGFSDECPHCWRVVPFIHVCRRPSERQRFIRQTLARLAATATTPTTSPITTREGGNDAR